MKVELDIGDNKHIGEFSLGYFSFENDGLVFTNKFKKPDQACMIFHSLPLLLDGLCGLGQKNRRLFVFCAIDCSYELVFERQKEKLKIYEHPNSSIECSFSSFTIELWNAYTELMNRYNLTSDDLDSISKELEQSINVFKAQFQI